jgi:hypothetical protein
MKEHFVNYNQALALKELGFDEPCLMQYNKSGLVENIYGSFKNSYFNHADQVTAPLKSQVFKWFRDKYKLIAYIEHYAEWNFEIFKIDENIAEVQDDVCFDYTFKGGTYEEAESACIDKLIEIIKEKKS